MKFRYNREQVRFDLVDGTEEEIALAVHCGCDGYECRDSGMIEVYATLNFKRVERVIKAHNYPVDVVD